MHSYMLYIEAIGRSGLYLSSGNIQNTMEMRISLMRIGMAKRKEPTARDMKG